MTTGAERTAVSSAGFFLGLFGFFFVSISLLDFVGRLSNEKIENPTENRKTRKSPTNRKLTLENSDQARGDGA